NPDVEMEPSSDLDVKADGFSITDAEVMVKQFDKLPYESLGTGHIVWEINDWAAQPERVTSPPFHCGGQTWRILLFPRGNSPGSESLAAFCEVVPPEDADEDWAVCAQFILGLGNAAEPEVHHFQQACHRFFKGETDWGFSRMLELKHLRSPSASRPRAILEDNALVMGLYVRVIRDPTGVLWHNFANYDSKKQTGYVGLLNQGATCYMNSLLQSLYFTNYFRKAVYQIPTKDDTPTAALRWLCSACFFSCRTRTSQSLTKSFGWDSIDSFMQHDVQEFNRVLQDNLEGKMKGTDAEGAIQRLFLGKMKSYITCINVQYESSRVEDYYDIQLNVKGCRGVRESFEKYVEVEFLDGDNKYMAEGHGLQDAKKGVIFDSFPPVLHLQLKRFDYDIMRDAMVKINDRYEFPDQITLDDFVSADADRSEPCDYVLHGVLVHSGDLHGGHYFALLKPQPDGHWYRFDDDRVTPAMESEVFEDNFGGEAHPLGLRPNPRAMKRFSNAYMLVYIRKSRLAEILAEVTADDIPDHLSKRPYPPPHLPGQRQRNENDAQAAAAKRRLEQDQQVGFMVLSDGSLRNQHLPGLVDPDKDHSPTGHLMLSCPKHQSLAWFKVEVSTHLLLASEEFRMWAVRPRQDHALRLMSLIDEANPDLTLAQVREKEFLNCRACVIYVETPEYFLQLHPTSPSPDDYLLMVKYFDRTTQTLEYLGKFYAPKRTVMEDIAKALALRLNLPPDTALELFEEGQQNQIDKVSLNLTVDKACLCSGDILCFQVASPEGPAVPGVVEYFEELNNQVRVYFKPKATVARMNVVDRAADMALDLHKKMPYHNVVELLGAHIQADPLKIRLYAPGGIRSTILHSVPYDPNVPLADVLGVLEVTVEELESKTPLDIHLLGNSTRELSKVTVLAPKDGCFDDVRAILETKLLESHPPPIHLRMYESDRGRFSRVLTQDLGIHEVPPSSTLYAEMLPPGHAAIEVPIIHFSREPSRTHGVPFLFPVLKDEPLASFHGRLASKLGVGNKELAKMRLALLTRDGAYDTLHQYIETAPDDDWAALAPDATTCLGLDHPDRTLRPSRFTERAIKIFN
ncbi:ubiquitin-specific protease ubp15, partial [Massospora cicadina]